MPQRSNCRTKVLRTFETPTGSRHRSPEKRPKSATIHSAPPHRKIISREGIERVFLCSMPDIFFPHHKISPAKSSRAAAMPQENPPKTSTSIIIYPIPRIRPKRSRNSITAWKSPQNHPTSIWKPNPISKWCATVEYYLVT